jgi:hypothetical protein
MNPTGNIERLDKTDLSPQEKKAITILVLGKDPSDCLSPGGTLKDAVGNIRIVRTELTAGEKDLLIQASDNCNCGGTGNCAFWILRKNPKDSKRYLQLTWSRHSRLRRQAAMVLKM